MTRFKGSARVALAIAVLTVSALTVVASPAPAPALGDPEGVVTNFPDPLVSQPYQITEGPDGNFWFTEPANDQIGQITPAGVVTKFADASIDFPRGITAGPDGALWFTNANNNSIGRITTAGAVTNFPDATINIPFGITAGPDGNLWFANQGGASIGRITTAGVVTDFTDATISAPTGIAAGPDGNLWFTNLLNNSIGQITPAGVVTNFTDASIAGPQGIAVGPDGNLWFANTPGDSIGRITTAGVVTDFPDSDIHGPFTIAAGPDGGMWFGNTGDNSIGRITTAGVVTRFADATIAGPYGITAGSDGNMWFTNQDNSSISRIGTGAVTPVSVTTASLPGGTVGTAYSQTLAAADGTTPYSWTVTVGSLPNGLNLAANGAITGTPTVAGNFPFTVEVTDSSTPAGTDTQALSITIAPAPVIPVVSIGNGAVVEGNARSRQLPFTVSLSAPASSTVTVDYATQSASATTGLDFVSQTGQATFAPGTKTSVVSINVKGEHVAERQEQFTVALSNPVNATLGRAVGTGTIFSDDTYPIPAVQVSVGNASIVEGDTGNRVLRFPVTLSNWSPTAAVTVRYRAVAGTATTADFTPRSGTATIPASALGTTVSITVKGDTANEPTESFKVLIWKVAGASLGRTSGVGQIMDDD